MRSRNIALGCALAGMPGFAALPPAPARAVSTARAAAQRVRSAQRRRVSAATAVSAARAVSRAAARRAVPILSISTSGTTYAYSSRVWLTVRLGRTHENRGVSIYAAPVGVRHWQYGHSGKVRRTPRASPRVGVRGSRVSDTEQAR